MCLKIRCDRVKTKHKAPVWTGLACRMASASWAHWRWTHLCSPCLSNCRRRGKMLLLPRHPIPNAAAAKWGETGFKRVVEEGEVLLTSTSARWSR